MSKVLRSLLPPLICAILLVFVVTGQFQAGGKQAKPLSKKQQKQLDNILRDVINRGAKVFNEEKDYSGCYRLWEGSLITVRPLLDGHPDLQKVIDKGLASAAANPSPVQKAFALRKALDRIRKDLGAAGAPPSKDKKAKDKKPADKKVKDKKVKDKKPADKKKTDKKKADKKPADKAADKKSTDKKPADKKAGDKKGSDKKASDKNASDKKEAAKGSVGAVSGTVKYNGQPLDGAVITFYPEKGKPVSAKTTPDGTYTFAKGVPLGKMKVTIAAPKSDDPAKPAIKLRPVYSDPEKSALITEIERGENVRNFELKD